MLKKIEKSMQSLDFIFPPNLFWLIVIGFMAIDFCTIYPIIDEMYYQSVTLSIIVSIGVVGLLELIPVALSHFFTKDEKESLDWAVMGCLLIAFLSLFVILFCLRWSVRASSFSTEDVSLGLDFNVETTVEETVSEESTMAENMMTILFGAMPLFTSIFLFALSCTQTRSSKKENKRRIACIELRQALGRLKIQEKELQEALEIDVEAQDEILLRSTLDELEAFRLLFYTRAREKLAAHLKDPAAVGILLDNNDGDEKN